MSASRLKVLVLTPDFPPARGGIQVLVHRLVDHAESLDATVVTIQADGWQAFDAQQGFRVVRVPVRSGFRQGSVVALNGRAALAALRSTPDVVLSAHIVTGPAAAMARRALGVPVVQYLYAKEIGAKRGLARFAVGHADTTIVISRYTEQLALGCGAQRSRMRLIPPGMDVPDRVGRHPHDGDGAPIVLTIARMEDRYKGHDVVIRALPLILARVPDARWVVIGDGPLRPQLEQLAVAHGVADRIDFLGSVSDGERDDWLARARVFIMPSRLPAGGFAGEGFGIVYLEASARGVPVVAGNVAGAVDAVIDGHTGLLVDPADHIAVADALADLLLDPARAAQLGANGRLFAKEFSWPKIARRVEQVLVESAAAGIQAAARGASYSPPTAAFMRRAVARRRPQ